MAATSLPIALNLKSTSEVFYLASNSIVRVYLDPVTPGTGSVVLYDDHGATLKQITVEETPGAIYTASQMLIAIAVDGATQYIAADRIVTLAIYDSTGSKIGYYDNGAELLYVISTDSNATIETAVQAIVANSIGEFATLAGPNLFTGLNSYSAATGITAFAGGGQASATLLAKEFNNVTTVATSADSVKLPVATLGMDVIVKNNGASDLAIFPNTGGTIDGGGANASITLAVGAVKEFRAISTTAWQSDVVVNAAGNQSIAGIKTFTNTTASTTKDTGAVIVEGGVGIEKEIFAGLSINAGTDLTAAGVITNTSASASALAVGLAGATNPSFVVDSSTASQAAGLKVTGAVAAGTVAATVVSSGADASLSIDAKGTGTLTLQGTATGNIIVGDDIVPDVDNTLDIGNLASNNRDIHASRSFINKGVASTEGYGQLALKYISASKAFAGGATEVIPVQVPTGAILVTALLRNDTTLVGAGAASYSAAYSTGSTQAISSGTNFVKNTKVTTPFDANAATAITSAATDITLTPNAGTLDTGTVTAVVYYYEPTALTDAA